MSLDRFWRQLDGIARESKKSVESVMLFSSEEIMTEDEKTQALRQFVNQDCLKILLNQGATALKTMTEAHPLYDALYDQMELVWKALQ